MLLKNFILLSSFTTLGAISNLLSFFYTPCIIEKIKHFSGLIFSYIFTGGSLRYGPRVSTQLLVFPISIRVDNEHLFTETEVNSYKTYCFTEVSVNVYFITYQKSKKRKNKANLIRKYTKYFINFLKNVKFNYVHNVFGYPNVACLHDGARDIFLYDECADATETV